MPPVERRRSRPLARGLERGLVTDAGEEDLAEHGEREGAQRRDGRDPLRGGAGLGLGGLELAALGEDRGEVGAGAALLPAVLLRGEGVDGLLLDGQRRGDLALPPQRRAEVLAGQGADVVEAHALGVGERGAQGDLGLAGIAELEHGVRGIDAAEAGVAAIAGEGEARDAELGELERRRRVAVAERARGVERVEAGGDPVVVLGDGAGDAVDLVDQRLGEGVLAVVEERSGEAGHGAHRGAHRRPGRERGEVGVRGSRRRGDGDGRLGAEQAVRLHLARELGELAVAAEAEAHRAGLGGGDVPERAAEGEAVHGLDGGLLGLGGGAPPLVGLGLEEAERAERLAAGVGRAAFGARHRRGEIVAFEGLLGGAAVALDGALGLARALEMLGEDRGLALARALEPLGAEAVAELAIALGEHGVGRVAHERVAEGVLVLPGNRPSPRRIRSSRSTRSRSRSVRPRVSSSPRRGRSASRQKTWPKTLAARSARR